MSGKKGMIIPKGLSKVTYIKGTELIYNYENCLKYFSKKQDNGCLIWTGFKSNSGYGTISYKNKKRLAHRVSYEYHFGKIPKNLLVCHKCDMKLCINKDHLFLGTHKDNMQDCIKKNRFPHHTLRVMKGSKNSLSKLNEAQVLEIRERSKNGETSISLAKEFDVSRININYIKSNKTWRHIL